MKIKETDIPGLLLIEPNVFTDERGEFVKNFSDEYFLENNLEFKPLELFYSSSRAGTIRGMHFQRPPYEHEKLVFCSAGEIIDLVVDLRSDSPTFRQYFAIKLSAKNKTQVFIPKGCAHGFLAVEESVVHYAVNSKYSQQHDTGIRWDSFGYNWNCENPIISERDASFQTLNNF